MLLRSLAIRRCSSSAFASNIGLLRRSDLDSKGSCAAISRRLPVGYGCGEEDGESSVPERLGLCVVGVVLGSEEVSNLEEAENR